MHFFTGLLLIFCANIAQAQKYMLEKSSVEFFSNAAIEDIRAENTRTLSIYNHDTGEIVVSIPIVDFQFENPTMQEHFNEKYLESEKFSKATFQGKFSSIKNSGGLQSVVATGQLTIHGVTRSVEIPGTVELAAGKMIAQAKFIVKLADYKIKVPQLLWQKIAEQIEVTVALSYKQ